MSDKPINRMWNDEQIDKAALLNQSERGEILRTSKERVVATPNDKHSFDVRREIGHDNIPDDERAFVGSDVNQDKSHIDTLKALGYTQEDILNNRPPSNKPLTVAELEERAAKGEYTDVNADIMHRYSPNKEGVIPANELAKVSDAQVNAITTNWSAASKLIPAKAPEDRAGHPGRVVHDPWASDPAGPNEGWNATQAREMFEHNADSILREHDGPTNEEQDNDPTEFDPSAYSDEDIESYRNDKD